MSFEEKYVRSYKILFRRLIREHQMNACKVQLSTSRKTTVLCAKSASLIARSIVLWVYEEYLYSSRHCRTNVITRWYCMIYMRWRAKLTLMYTIYSRPARGSDASLTAICIHISPASALQMAYRLFIKGSSTSSTQVGGVFDIFFGRP